MVSTLAQCFVSDIETSLNQDEFVPIHLYGQLGRHSSMQTSSAWFLTSHQQQNESMEEKSCKKNQFQGKQTNTILLSANYRKYFSDEFLDEYMSM